MASLTLLDKILKSLNYGSLLHFNDLHTFVVQIMPSSNNSMVLKVVQITFHYKLLIAALNSIRRSSQLHLN